jgi:tetratricopeptide (TPR) repeat protein
VRLPDIAPLADRLTRHAGTAWIQGTEGSGRSTLMAALRERLPDVAVLDLLPLEHADATGHVAASMAALLPDPARRSELLALPVVERHARLADAVRGSAGRVIVRVDPSWFYARRATEDERAGTAANALLALAQITAIWLVDAGFDPAEVGWAPALRERLPAYRCRLLPEGFEGYAPAAHALLRAVGHDTEASPQVWRLAVGAVALGDPPGRVAALVTRASGADVRGLLPVLFAGIRRASLQSEVRRLVQARRPLPRTALVDIVGPPVEHVALFTQCLGYGDPVRVPPRVQSWLRGAVHAAPHKLEPTHAALAEHARSLDGVSDPSQIGTPERITAWFDKVHHLARGGAASRVEWDAQQHPTPESYWDLARHLSIERKRFDEAAEVYRRCMDRFPSDDYAAHYCAFNQDKAQRSRQEIESGFRTAVRLSPSNPWWNARLVTFLIRRGAYFEADRAWRQALACVDPDGARVARDPWLVAHLHGWVIDGWLTAGQWPHAAALLNTIPDPVLRRATEYRPMLATLRGRVSQQAVADRRRFNGWMSEHGPDAPVARAWRAIADAADDPPAPPSVTPGDEPGSTALTWSTPRFVVRVEVDEASGLYWYARDRAAERSADGEGVLPTVPEPLLVWLARIRHA